MTPTPSTIDRRMQDEPALLAAMRDARTDALRRHASAGIPVVAWRDGKVVELPPDAALAEHLRRKQTKPTDAAA
ncbi:MAG TPA: hypothetical protein PKE29_16220 [Phycisphaerales bacterium]|nr:hypothetical protein [Phycisphaerales bacterium]